MKTITAIGAVSIAILMVGCAHKQPAGEQASATATTTATTTATSTPSASGAASSRMVKSKNGAYEGEIVGNIAPNSRFAKLQIGMTMAEVSSTIGAADDMHRHETGKRWIPFYFGNDSQRIQTFYKNEGCLTFTGGNVFGGGGNELIRITAAPKGGCMDS